MESTFLLSPGPLVDLHSLGCPWPALAGDSGGDGRGLKQFFLHPLQELDTKP